MKYKILFLLIGITLFLSIFNWYEEGEDLYTFGYFLAVNFAAIFSGSLSSCIAYYADKKNSIYKIPLLIAAYISSTFGLIVYIFYALNGQAENSSTSSAHTHVIFFPVMHFILTLGLIFIALIFGVLIKLWRKYA
jgi:hypothetical protein